MNRSMVAVWYINILYGLFIIFICSTTEVCAMLRMTRFAKTPAMQAAHILASRQLSVGANSVMGSKNLPSLSKRFFCDESKWISCAVEPKKIEDGMSERYGYEYEKLELALRAINSKWHQLKILAEIHKANVWHDFRLVCEEMKRAGSQGLEQERRLESLEKELENKKLDGYTRRSYGSRGPGYYAEMYFEAEQRKTYHPPTRQRTLKLIGEFGIYFTLDETLAKMMDSAEGDRPMEYEFQEYWRTGLEKKSLEAELSKYTKTVIQINEERFHIIYTKKS